MDLVKDLYGNESYIGYLWILVALISLAKHKF